MSRFGPPSDSLFGGMDGDQGQGRPAFPPAAPADAPPAVLAEVADMNASGRRARSIQAVLDALRTGPKTSDELAVICRTHRYSARVYDLRRLGFVILFTPLGGGKWLHTLTTDIERSEA
jgi:hypothetical protein